MLAGSDSPLDMRAKRLEILEVLNIDKDEARELLAPEIRGI